MNIVNYSDKSFVITGNTKDFKDELKELGGRWNSKLTCGNGWVFSLTKKKELESWLETKSSSTTTATVIQTQTPTPTKKETLFDQFVDYIKPFYVIRKKLDEILYDFGHGNKDTKDNCELYMHYYKFFRTVKIDHTEYQRIDKDKFIEHALIQLLHC